MEKVIEFKIEIYPDENTIYIGEDNSSSSKYKFKNIDDITSSFEQYLKIYHPDNIRLNIENLYRNFKLSNGNYLKVDRIYNGYEFSYYDKNKRLIDGGIIEDMKSLNIKEILKMLSINPDNIDISLINEEIEENI